MAREKRPRDGTPKFNDFRCVRMLDNAAHPLSSGRRKIILRERWKNTAHLSFPFHERDNEV